MSLNRISFEVTNRCNLRCIHCMREEPTCVLDLPPELIESVLKQGREHYGLKSTAFTGGELFLHPRIGDILEITARLEMQYAFVTNGLVIPRFLELLKRPHLRKYLSNVCVSLEATEAAANDKVRGAGSYKKAMAAIVALKSAEIPVNVKLTINRLNMDRLEQSILEISHLGVQGLEIAPMMPTPDNIAQGLMPGPEESRKAFDAVARMSRELKLPIFLVAGQYEELTFYSCAALYMMDLYVDVKGRLCLCCMLPGSRGRDPEREEGDVIADLSKVSLVDAHRRLMEVVNEVYRARLDRIEKGGLSTIEHYPCVSCLRHFGKLDWIRDYPESPWNGLSLKLETVK